MIKYYIYDGKNYPDPDKGAISMFESSITYEGILTEKSHNRLIMKKERTRSAILASACRILNSYPPSEVTVERIANDLSLARGTFYSHFRNKDHMIAELLNEFFDFAWNSRPPNIPSGGPFEKILNANLYYCKIYEANAYLMAAIYIFSSYDTKLASASEEFNARYCNIIMRILLRRHRDCLQTLDETKLLSILRILCAAADETLRGRFVQKDKFLCECFPTSDSLAESLSIIWNRTLFRV